MKHFEPVVVGFCCTFCADNAGSGAQSKTSAGPSVRIIKLPCVGKIDAIHVLKAFAAGADGIFVTGGPFGQCRFIEGMTSAVRKRLNIQKNF